MTSMPCSAFGTATSWTRGSVDDQERLALVAGKARINERGRNERWALAWRLAMQGQLNPKLRTFSGSAAETNSAAHQLSEALGDGKTNAGSLDRPGLLPGALERLKDLVLLLLRNADAVISNEQSQSVAGRPLCGDLH